MKYLAIGLMLLVVGCSKTKQADTVKKAETENFVVEMLPDAQTMPVDNLAQIDSHIDEMTKEIASYKTEEIGLRAVQATTKPVCVPSRWIELAQLCYECRQKEQADDYCIEVIQQFPKSEEAKMAKEMLDENK